LSGCATTRTTSIVGADGVFAAATVPGLDELQADATDKEMSVAASCVLMLPPVRY
jgi:hypothetical protein